MPLSHGAQVTAFVLALGAIAVACAGEDPIVAPGGTSGTSGTSGVVCKGDTVEACGPTCEACAAPRGGRATCDAGKCGKVCDATSTSKLCGADCADTQSDAKNCGACGKSCGTGACVGSRCLPETVADALAASPVTFDVDAAKLAIAFADRIVTCDMPAGCPAGTSPRGVGSGYANGKLAWLSGTDVLFSGSDTDGTTHFFVRCPTSGCAKQAPLLDAISSFIGEPFTAGARTATHVAWSRVGTDGTSASLYSCPLPGCAFGNVVYVQQPAADQKNPIRAMAASSTTIFYAVERIVAAASEVVVRSCPIDVAGCATPATLTDPRAPTDPYTAMAWSAQKLYLAGSSIGDHRIEVIGETGSAPVTLAVDGPGVANIVVDATDVLWTNTTKGTVSRCPIAGCPGQVPEVLASNQTGVSVLRLHGGYVYWATSTAIRRLAR